MKKATIITLAICCIAGIASAQSVVGTPHDLSSSSGNTGAISDIDRVCVFCHTPHQAAAAAGQYPLWNHTMSTGVAAYGVYSSVTMNASPGEIAGAAAGAQSVSLLCMGCHDGTVAVESLYNETNGLPSPTVTGSSMAGAFLTGNALVGTDLTDDHPVNFAYDNALVGADGELDTVANVTADGLLVGTFVQCSSCHDPHNNTHGSFLTTNNDASNLCLQCHLK